jgi:glycosyltransferase involved in cell wall biosynthesis
LNTLFLICGDGPLREELEQYAASAEISNVVRFLGWRTDVSDVLSASDCTILPSLSENLSLAALQSLMVGTPVVATSVGGMAEAIRHGETGLLVPPGSASTLAEALLWMVAHPEACREMGSRGRDDAQRRFTRQRMLDEYVACFASLSRPSLRTQLTYDMCPSGQPRDRS